MSDDVARMRAASEAARKAEHHFPADQLAEAALTIERLRAENATLTRACDKWMATSEGNEQSALISHGRAIETAEENARLRAENARLQLAWARAGATFDAGRVWAVVDAARYVVNVDGSDLVALTEAVEALDERTGQ